MKSTFNLIVFGSTLATLAAVLVGCGDDSSGASCAQVCVNITAAKCANDPDCMTTCNKVKDATPMGCTGVYNALSSCSASAKFTCDDQKQSVAKDCSKQETAYAKCLASGGKASGDKDAGDAADGGSHGSTKGTGGTKGSGSGPITLKHVGFGGSGGTTAHDAGADAGGNGGSGSGGKGAGGTSGSNACSGAMVQGACAQCIEASCCDGVLACHNDADCTALEDCAAQCGDSTCIQTCADASTQSAVDLYNTLITCATDHCQSECADSTSSDAGTSAGGADVGAPNDGNTGHGSATTPTDCLDVPSDVTGYCGDQKYKVIYDCPNGAPYSDCQLNTMNSSGVYCCGH